MWTHYIYWYGNTSKSIRPCLSCDGNAVDSSGQPSNRRNSSAKKCRPKSDLGRHVSAFLKSFWFQRLGAEALVVVSNDVFAKYWNRNITWTEFRLQPETNQKVEAKFYCVYCSNTNGNHVTQIFSVLQLDDLTTTKKSCCNAALFAVLI